VKDILKPLILGIIALLAAFFWPKIANLNPPFDGAMFSDLLVWLGGLILSAVFGWKLKTMNRKIKSATFGAQNATMNEKPAWLNLVLGAVALAASLAWPLIAKYEPPLDMTMFSDLLVWIVTIVLGAVFGWNGKSAIKQ